jgi:hypothetical protein
VDISAICGCDSTGGCVNWFKAGKMTFVFLRTTDAHLPDIGMPQVNAVEAHASHVGHQNSQELARSRAPQCEEEEEEEDEGGSSSQSGGGDRHEGYTEGAGGHAVRDANNVGVADGGRGGHRIGGRGDSLVQNGMDVDGVGVDDSLAHDGDMGNRAQKEGGTEREPFGLNESRHERIDPERWHQLPVDADAMDAGRNAGSVGGSIAHGGDAVDGASKEGGGEGEPSGLDGGGGAGVDLEGQHHGPMDGVDDSLAHSGGMDGQAQKEGGMEREPFGLNESRHERIDPDRWHQLPVDADAMDAGGNAGSVDGSIAHDGDAVDEASKEGGGEGEPSGLDGGGGAGVDLEGQHHGPMDVDSNGGGMEGHPLGHGGDVSEGTQCDSMDVEMDGGSGGGENVSKITTESGLVEKPSPIQENQCPSPIEPRKNPDRMAKARKEEEPLPLQPGPKRKQKSKPAPKPEKWPAPRPRPKPQPQAESVKLVERNYFEEIEYRGVSRIVDMIDLTQEMVSRLLIHNDKLNLLFACRWSRQRQMSY